MTALLYARHGFFDGHFAGFRCDYVFFFFSPTEAFLEPTPRFPPAMPSFGHKNGPCQAHAFQEC